MDYKRVLSVQDISCFGQCSLTVALPILSACGAETVILPSAVLSTHTGGFTGFTFRDLTDDMPAIIDHWQKEGISFDAVYTGYLGSERQIGIVADIFDRFGGEKLLKVVDPAMADNGKLYYGFDNAFAKSMARLCAKADVILPNITEACFMTDTEYKEEYDRAYVDGLFAKLEAIGVKCTVLTGVSLEAQKTGVAVYENGKTQIYAHEKLANGCHGTGDIFASAFVGALLSGKTKIDAARIAADYVVECIKYTAGDEKHKYGAKFEPVLPKLIASLQ